MQYMGNFDATTAAAVYRDTEITQEHASQKNRCGSQLGRDHLRLSKLDLRKSNLKIKM